MTQLPSAWTELGLRKTYGPNGNCLHTARIALSICEHYGIEAEPVFGAFIAFNRKGYRCFKNRTEPLPPSAWSVGVDREEPTGTNVGGHAYVVAKQDEEAWLIDLSAVMADRPQRGMAVPPLVLNFKDAFDVFEWEDRGIACVWREGNATLLYTSGDTKWTAPWEWDSIPPGYTVKRNRPEITKMIRYLDGKLQL